MRTKTSLAVRPQFPGRFLACAAVWALTAPGADAAAPKTILWERQAHALPESIWSVESIDANGDGKKDLIAMGVTKVYALVAPGWKEHVLLDIKEGKMLYCAAMDVNRDGAMDLALGRYSIPWIDFRTARAAGKVLPEPLGPDFSVAWIENPRRIAEPWPLHVVDRELNGIHGVCVGDVDGDGQPDLMADSISGPFFPNSLAWFSVPAGGSAAAERHIVTKSGADGRPHYLDFADVNDDRRGDILLGDSGAGTFTWWERGLKSSEPWTKHLIAQIKGATNLKAADLNGDGRPDVVGTCGHGNGVYWFEGPAWKKHDIDPALPNPHALAVGDFDGDGDPDVAVASYTAFIVRWYENDRKGFFIPHDIDTGNRQEAYDLKTADVDGDGRPDLILAGRESKNAVIYFNRAPSSGSTAN